MQLALRSASVDIVTAVFLLFHLEEPLHPLQEARRVLRPGGRMGAVTWATGEFESEATRTWTKCLDDHGAPAVEPVEPSSYEALDAPDKMETLFHEAAFTSARAWREELHVPIEREHLLRLRTEMGRQKPRFDALAPAARSACIADARGRMAAMDPRDFVTHGAIVFAVAEA